MDVAQNSQGVVFVKGSSLDDSINITSNATGGQFVLITSDSASSGPTVHDFTNVTGPVIQTSNGDDVVLVSGGVVEIGGDVIIGMGEGNDTFAREGGPQFFVDGDFVLDLGPNFNQINYCSINSSLNVSGDMALAATSEAF